MFLAFFQISKIERRGGFKIFFSYSIRYFAITKPLNDHRSRYGNCREITSCVVSLNLGN